MSASEDLGFQRGSADKLAGRPNDDSPPAAVSGRAAVADYKRGYKRGYGKTKRVKGDSTGASWSVEFGTSPAPGSEGNADQGFAPANPIPEPAPYKLSTNALKGLSSAILPKAPIAVAQRQSATPFAPAPSAAPPAPMPMQTMPGVAEGIANAPSANAPPPMQTAMVLSTSDKVMSWMKDHWQYLAVGAGVIAVGATIYVVAHKKTQAQQPQRA